MYGPPSPPPSPQLPLFPQQPCNPLRALFRGFQEWSPGQFDEMTRLHQQLVEQRWDRNLKSPKALHSNQGVGVPQPPRAPNSSRMRGMPPDSGRPPQLPRCGLFKGLLRASRATRGIEDFRNLGLREQQRAAHKNGYPSSWGKDKCRPHWGGGAWGVVQVKRENMLANAQVRLEDLVEIIRSAIEDGFAPRSRQSCNKRR